MVAKTNQNSIRNGKNKRGVTLEKSSIELEIWNILRVLVNTLYTQDCGRLHTRCLLLLLSAMKVIKLKIS